MKFIRRLIKNENVNDDFITLMRSLIMTTRKFNVIRQDFLKYNFIRQKKKTANNGEQFFFKIKNFSK